MEIQDELLYKNPSLSKLVLLFTTRNFPLQYISYGYLKRLFIEIRIEIFYFKKEIVCL